MKDDHKKQDKTLVEDHALRRLHKVEKEQRKPYIKQKGHFSVQNILMGFLFVVILVVMVIGMIR
ncbi:hypothetical protein [uncultured Limosilactobacillus sp.]|uniref:hypothetical protein n=1 Tax=uncultured Limosilactobacillus sp. TaxID=2837629 RepID=UPI0025CC75E7|nr:hypothetical protein [uncultured Limosilactobacillus sp.]